MWASGDAGAPVVGVPWFNHCRYGIRSHDQVLAQAPPCVSRLGLQPLGGKFPIEAIQEMQVNIFRERFGTHPEATEPRPDAHLYATPRAFALG